MTSRNLLLCAFVLTAALVAANSAFAWTGPSVGAPGGNAVAPINVSGTGQTKAGGLVLNSGGAPIGLSVYGKVGIGTITPDAPLRITFSDNTGGVTGLHIQNTNGGASAYSGVYYFSNTDTTSGSVFQGFNNSTHEFSINNVASAPSLNFMTGSASRIYVSSAGNVGIGTTAPGQKLDVAGAVQAGAFYYSSDERLKKNIEAIAKSKALQDILALRPVTYNWKDPAQPTDTQIGFIAQQVETIAPALVTTNSSTGMKAVDYARVAPLLVGAIQAQQAQIDALKAEIEQLKAGR